MPLVQELDARIRGRLIYRCMMHIEEGQHEGTFVFAGWVFSYAHENNVLNIWRVT